MGGQRFEPAARPAPRGPGRALASLAAVVALTAAACGSTTDDSAADSDGATADSAADSAATTAGAPAGTAADDTAAPADNSASDGSAPATPSDGSALVTPCFSTGPGLVLPDTWVAADVSTEGSCLFVLQAEGLADTTAIAGELFLSGGGQPFEEFVSQVEGALAAGQEPDILALGLLNTGASGRDLPIVERIELDSPNRAVILVHESDRRAGWWALSAVVDVPTESDPATTHALILWGLLLPTSEGGPELGVNYGLMTDLINSMQVVPQ